MWIRNTAAVENVFYRAEILHAVVSADGPELVHVRHQRHPAPRHVHRAHIRPPGHRVYNV
jgi:hypothetical protein